MEENQWVESVEKLLRAPPKSSMDAEEISVWSLSLSYYCSCWVVCFIVTALLVEENQWVESVEKLLRAPPKSSMDAEEISEELDVSAILYPICPLLINHS